MSGISEQDIADLMLATEPARKKNSFTDLITTLQDYIAWGQFVKNNSIGFDGGSELKFQALVAGSNNARTTGLYAQDNVQIVDHMTEGKMPWRHVTTSWGFDRRELAMKTSSKEIVDFITVRHSVAVQALADLVEELFWGCPTYGDTRDPHGLLYWVVKNASEGFNGGAPSGYTTVGDLNPTTYPNWKNYSGTYTDYTMDTLVKKMRLMAYKTGWKALADIRSKEQTFGGSRGYYTTWNVVGYVERLLEYQNDNLGNDLEPITKAFLRRAPVVPVPFIDNNTLDSMTDPIYQIDWTCFRPVFLNGEFRNESKPKQAANQHTVTEVHEDTTMNFLCTNRRKQGVLYKA